MLVALRSRSLIWLAVMAWLAQICLPAAHAAVMAEQGGGMAVWCGTNSPGMQAQLAKLPDEVREILEQGGAQAEKHSDCVSYCSTTGTAPLASTPITVRLREAGLDSRIAAPAPAPRDRVALSPPVRGPPPSV